MANKNLFASQRSTTGLTTNAAGGQAYQLDDKEALVQLVTTGFLADTFYKSAEEQLKEITTLTARVLRQDPEFIAKLAIYSRDKAYMKDTPALLLALMTIDPIGLSYVKRIFSTVIDNEKMLKNFVQMIRSGKVGRKSLGTSLKKLINKWVNERSVVNLFKGNIGKDPSLGDVLKLAHVKAISDERNALFNYIIGGNALFESKKTVKPSFENLPKIVREFENWRISGDKTTLPNVPFQMLTSYPLSNEQWALLAGQVSWHTLLKNINTFERHGVFNNHGAKANFITRLKDPESVQKAKIFPYEIFSAYLNITDSAIKAALLDVVKIALKNIPEYSKNVVVCVDRSGSMDAAVSGNRGSATSKMTCQNAANLIACAIASKNEQAHMISFTTSARNIGKFANPQDIFGNAAILAEGGSGGTAISSALQEIESSNIPADVVIILSDNESWAETGNANNTASNIIWERLRARNPKIKLVSIDLQTNSTVQVNSARNVLNIGGFSDAMFTTIFNFLGGLNTANVLLHTINSVVLPA